MQTAWLGFVVQEFHPNTGLVRNHLSRSEGSVRSSIAETVINIFKSGACHLWKKKYKKFTNMWHCGANSIYRKLNKSISCKNLTTFTFTTILLFHPVGLQIKFVLQFYLLNGKKHLWNNFPIRAIDSLQSPLNTGQLISHQPCT